MLIHNMQITLQNFMRYLDERTDVFEDNFINVLMTLVLVDKVIFINKIKHSKTTVELLLII